VKLAIAGTVLILALSVHIAYVIFRDRKSRLEKEHILKKRSD